MPLHIFLNYSISFFRNCPFSIGSFGFWGAETSLGVVLVGSEGSLEKLKLNEPLLGN